MWEAGNVRQRQAAKPAPHLPRRRAVRRPFHPTRRRRERWLGRVLCAALLVSAGCGFHNYWDTVTSRDLPWQERLWPKAEEPLQGVQKSNDGAQRAKAPATLRDPGQAPQRGTYLNIL